MAEENSNVNFQSRMGTENVYQCVDVLDRERLQELRRDVYSGERGR